jgi:5-amino-6-(5-phosphoribosylamino)uracil reductase
VVAYGDQVPRPYVLLSAAVSLDGALDDRSPRRRVLSGPQDLDAVDALRAGCDAILVGAGTVRADDPRLLVRSAARRAERVRRGLPPDPLRVVLTRHALDPASALFRTGTPPLVYGGPANLAAAATVRPEAALPDVLADLAVRGVGRLLVEGGAAVLTGFLAAGLADELRLAVAPVFIGDPAAPRFLGPAVTGRPPTLRATSTAGDVAVLHYAF